MTSSDTTVDTTDTAVKRINLRPWWVLDQSNTEPYAFFIKFTLLASQNYVDTEDVTTETNKVDTVAWFSTRLSGGGGAKGDNLIGGGHGEESVAHTWRREVVGCGTHLSLLANGAGRRAEPVENAVGTNAPDEPSGVNWRSAGVA
jgi:hypothetical protein